MTAYPLKLQHLHLAVKSSLIARFLKLIEHGFKLKIRAGLSIRELFCVHLGISHDYFENRIQTIFLDGMPVDNVDVAWVDDGSRIALSAAMPGLVGATFRKDGAYASFRGTISYAEQKKAPVKGEAMIKLKFFNMIAKELGPAFLQKGIMVEGNTFQNFILQNSDDLKAACSVINLNYEKVDIAKLAEINWKNTEIFLQVTAEEES
jgi:hypothetical protein